MSLLLRRCVVLTSLGEDGVPKPWLVKNHMRTLGLGPIVVELKASPGGRYPIGQPMLMETNATDGPLRNLVGSYERKTGRRVPPVLNAVNASRCSTISSSLIVSCPAHPLPVRKASHVVAVVVTVVVTVVLISCDG